MTMLHLTDPVAQQAAEDYGQALQIAQHYWPQASDEDVRAAAASVLIYIQNERDPRRGSAAQAGQARGAASPRPAPASAPAGDIPPCPKCGGPMEVAEKRTDKSPDFRCIDTSCRTRGKDGKMYRSTAWKPKDQAENTGYAQQHERGRSLPPSRESYERNPLDELDEDDSLPF